MIVYPIKFKDLEVGEVFYVPSPDQFSAQVATNDETDEPMYVDECLKILSETETNAVLVNLSTGFHMDKDETVYVDLDDEEEEEDWYITDNGYE